MVRSALITGCNRGIGLELVKRFLSQDINLQHLFATCRDPSSAETLKELQTKHKEKLHILKLDVTHWSEHSDVVAYVKKTVGVEKGLNLLINNAGVLPSLKTLEDITPDVMVQAYETNCVAPIFLTRAFLPLLRTSARNALPEQAMTVEGACVVEMSTVLASIAE